MIRLLNTRKEEKQFHIRKKNRRRKTRIAITAKNDVTWPRTVGTRKTRERKKARMRKE